jgi:DNA-binding NtrC family response regulator
MSDTTTTRATAALYRAVEAMESGYADTDTLPLAVWGLIDALRDVLARVEALEAREREAHEVLDRLLAGEQIAGRV